MFTDNICKFVPPKSYDEVLNTVNFVYETQPSHSKELSLRAMYMLYIVVSGCGTLHMSGKSTTVREGDLFITFPASPFAIEQHENLTYMYISFIGIRASHILESLNIKAGDVFYEYDWMISFWMNTLQLCRQNNISLMTEGVLLYTLGHIVHNLSDKAELTTMSEMTLIIKKYIDDNFSKTDLTLENTCQLLGYNAKYVSSAFKRQMKCGFNEYLRSVRIQQACHMMKKGFACISEIALFCGYSDPLYFSKCFKKLKNMSPSSYIQSLK